jgi:hypothetical protein
MYYAPLLYSPYLYDPFPKKRVGKLKLGRGMASKKLEKVMAEWAQLETEVLMHVAAVTY